MTKLFLVLMTVLLTSLVYAEDATETSQKEKSIIQKRQEKARQNQEANFDTNKQFMASDKEIRNDASEEIQAQEDSDSNLED